MKMYGEKKNGLTMKTHDFTLVNLDTDSVSFSKPDGSPFTEEEQTSLLVELNSQFPEQIKWEHDGIYESFIVLKIKNYIMKQNGKVSKKGSSLKSSKIEPRLKDFMSEIIDCLLAGNTDNIINVYNKYVREVHNLKDISPWSSKKTITESVLNPARTNEQKILDALKGRPVSQGDKIYVYFAEERSATQVPRYKTDRKTKEKVLVCYVEKEVVANPLRMKEDWQADKPDHCVDTLLDRLYNTIKIFKNVINIELFPKYTLKANKEKLKEVLSEENS